MEAILAYSLIGRAMKKRVVEGLGDTVVTLLGVGFGGTGEDGGRGSVRRKGTQTGPLPYPSLFLGGFLDFFLRPALLGGLLHLAHHDELPAQTGILQDHALRLLLEVRPVLPLVRLDGLQDAEEPENTGRNNSESLQHVMPLSAHEGLF